MKKLIVANWKMNPRTAKDAIHLFTVIAQGNYSQNVSIVLCPPFTYLYLVSNASRGSVSLGAQNVFWESSGPYTGEISPAMLKDAGVKYVIIGHSERREGLGENNLVVASKVRAALRRGLKVVLCIGEPLSVRSRGILAAKSFVANQLKECLSLLGKPAKGGVKLTKKEVRARWENLIIAYEPVWAISTSEIHKEETPEDAALMIASIKKTMHASFPVTYSRMQVIYGGSVNSGNIGSFLSESAIDGALVGSASLNPGEFKKIIQIAGESK